VKKLDEALRYVEDLRRNFIEALEDWIAAHLLWNLALLQIGSHTISVSKETIPVA
jgi:hypothetical protein